MTLQFPIWVQEPFIVTLAMLVMHLPVAMRAAPTAIDQSGTAAHYGSWGNEATTACSAVPVIRAGDSKTSVNVDLTFLTH